MKNIIICICIVCSYLFLNVSVRGETTTFSSNKVMSPNKAFQLELSAQNPTHLIANFTIAPYHYLYQDRIYFNLLDNTKALKKLPANFPEAETKQDPYFGKQKVYHQNFSVDITLPTNTQGRISVQAHYQGCSEQSGVCYPPQEKEFSVVLPSASVANIQPDLDESLPKSDFFQHSSRWLILFGFFVAGILLSLTPCVLPMIPVLSAMLALKASTPRHSFILACLYVLGMSLSYTIIGVIASLSGVLMSQALQTPWVLGFISLIFVLLALNLLDVYTLNWRGVLLPASATTHAQSTWKANSSVFVMGALSALVLSPCIAPPLMGALLYMGKTHDVVLGASALFVMAWGMGIPLLIIGASAGHILPKVGAWMNGVRHMFGFALLGLAIYTINPFVSPVIAPWLWVLLLGGIVVYSIRCHVLPRTLRTILALLSMILIIWLSPYWSQNKHATLNLPALKFQTIHTLSAWDTVLKHHSNQPIMLDFYADWCVSCREFEAKTLTDERVKKLLADTLLVRADVTANGPEQRILLQHFHLFGPPAVLFFNAQGQEFATIRRVGSLSSRDFMHTIRQRNQCLETKAC